jgi:hypothetical protein
VESIDEKWRQLIGKVGEWYVTSQYLQGCILCLSRLMIDGLAPRASIECTDRMLMFMDLVSLVVGHRQELGLRLLLH